MIAAIVWWVHLIQPAIIIILVITIVILIAVINNLKNKLKNTQRTIQINDAKALYKVEQSINNQKEVDIEKAEDVNISIADRFNGIMYDTNKDD